MADVPVYFRFFIDDYLRDAEELSMLRHGAYLKLMLWYYGRAKPIPFDLGRAYARCGAYSNEEKEAVVRVLEEFFVLDANMWRHKRIDQELERWRLLSSAAKASVQVREQIREQRNKNNGRALSNDDRTMIEGSSNQNQNQSNTKTLKPLSGSQANTDAVAVLQFLNSKANRHFRPTPITLKPILARLKDGATVGDCKAVILHRIRAWAGDDKTRRWLQPSTLFRASNFANYMGDVPPEEELVHGD